MLNMFLAMLDSEEEKSKFILIYERYGTLMHYVANDILKDNQLAEDAVQEAFLRVAKNFHKVGEVTCPQTKNFLVIIVRNIALTMRKKELHDNLISIDDEAFKGMQLADEKAFENIDNQLLIEKILGLPEIYKTALYLISVLGYSKPEAANLLGISVDAVKKRVQRARNLLADNLRKEDIHHEK